MQSTRQGAPPPYVVLLGPQRFDSTLGSVVRGLHCEGPIALITAGWREREDEDEALVSHLACETVNLRLYHRAVEVFARDRELAEAHRAKQTTLRHKQDFYRIRLEHELEAAHVIRHRRAPAELLASEERASIEAIRMLDAYHLERCQRVQDRFVEQTRLYERPAIVEHRAQIAAALARCSAIAIAGGHVVSMLNRMRLFGLRELIDGQGIFAWSGGGMVISERVVLFHDSPPQGQGASMVLSAGLGLVGGVVMLPSPEARLRMHDPERVELLVRRFAPARCLAFPMGAHVIVRGGRFEGPSDVIELDADGGHRPLRATPAPTLELEPVAPEEGEP